mmetsp:Transcript_2793/g.7339  ORF Transcript_2793/g.7339 Transcript_2793/m.7339 type:complete len:229 (+) Transcript_2793:329-1015(+)
MHLSLGTLPNSSPRRIVTAIGIERITRDVDGSLLSSNLLGLLALRGRWLLCFLVLSGRLLLLIFALFRLLGRVVQFLLGRRLLLGLLFRGLRHCVCRHAAKELRKEPARFFLGRFLGLGLFLLLLLLPFSLRFFSLFLGGGRVLLGCLLLGRLLRLCFVLEGFLRLVLGRGGGSGRFLGGLVFGHGCGVIGFDVDKAYRLVARCFGDMWRMVIMILMRFVSSPTVFCL